MRKLLVKILQILDGTPAVYAKPQSGQSVVELALVTPLLIILLAGLIEIGWFANNYLTLLDVTRAGARRGTVLQDQMSPIFWDNIHSYVPNLELPAAYQMPNNAANGSDIDRYFFRWRPAGNEDPLGTGNRGVLPCNATYTPERTFYSEVTCIMIASMDPLQLNPSNGIDDIIVSGFSLQLVDPSKRSDWLAPYPIRPINADVPQVVVAGRYPTNANECDVLNVGGVPILSPRELRDPFDINHNSHVDVYPVAGKTVMTGTDDFSEIAGYDATAASVSDAEKQVGFSLFGNHKIDGTYCIGSEWTMSQVEAMFNLPDYDVTSNDEKDVLPSQGLVLVEMYWEHEMLLKIPILSPVYTAVGNQDGKIVINVWAAFPLPTVEPYIQFPCPPATGQPTPTGCNP